jgi:type I restriction enzyme, S subunit
MRNLKFKDFITLQRGFDLPNKDRIEGPYPVLASTSVNGYHSEYKVQPPGVVTGRSGSLGTIQFVDTPFWPLNTTLWVKDFKGNNPKYVYYYLQTMHLEDYNAGTGVPTLNRNHLDEINIYAHNLEEQHNIASILSAYDDLIENNNRRIKLLEQAAHDLYREWFVYFRFPGHEQVEMIDSGTEYGMIPHGWEVKRFGDVTENFDSKRIPVSAIDRTKMQGKYPYYGASGIIDFVNNYIFEGRYLLVAEDGENLRSRKTSVAFFATGKFWVNNHAHIIRGKSLVSAEYLQILIQNLNLSPYITGAAQPKLSQSNLNQIPVLIASNDIQRKFDEFVCECFIQKELLEQKNILLKEARDLLLPRLVSGELDVSEINIEC